MGTKRPAIKIHPYGNERFPLRGDLYVMVNFRTVHTIKLFHFGILRRRLMLYKLNNVSLSLLYAENHFCSDILTLVVPLQMLLKI